MGRVEESNSYEYPENNFIITIKVYMIQANPSNLACMSEIPKTEFFGTTSGLKDCPSFVSNVGWWDMQRTTVKVL